MAGKVLRIIIILCFVHQAAGATVPTKEQVGLFRNSKTCIVTESGISFFNKPVKEAVSKFWKITGFEFIDQDEFNKRKTSPKYSFIILMQGSFDKDPGGVSYSYISLVLGDPSGNLAKMPEFCSIPLSYSGDNDADYEYVIPAVIKFMQIHVSNIEKDRLPITLNGLKYYDKTGFKDKILLLNKDKVAKSLDTKEKISAYYPYNFELLTPEEIQTRLDSNSKNVIFHFHVGPSGEMGSGKCFEMLFDSEGNLYYYNARKITNINPDGFNTGDFNHIV